MSRLFLARVSFGAAVLCAGAACKSGEKPEAPAVLATSSAEVAPEPAPVASAAAAPSPVVVATAVPASPPIVSAAYAKLSDEDLAVPEDFQEETKRTIDQKNYKKELDKIEKELGSSDD
jgi:hypothetical protein